MCGYIFTEVEKKLNLRILSSIKNRGPDFSKLVRINNKTLYHARLKIVDLSSKSNQPFIDKSKRFYLLYNGEIYNFNFLKKKYNLFCKTKSDTEVLFLLLKKFGIKKTLKKISGMFSFVFIDKKKNYLCCARDHFGQKPLYFNFENNKFSCCTNIKPLVELLNIKEINPELANFYLSSNGILPPNNTIFTKIKSLPAGHFLVYENKKIKINEYFHPTDLISKNNFKKNLDLSKEEKIIKLKKICNQSIKNHLISDVKVGVCLSGGIDSSLVAHFMSRNKKKICSFSGLSKGIETIPKRIIPYVIKENRLKKFFFYNNRKKNYLKGLTKVIKNLYAPCRWGGVVPMLDLCKLAKKNNYKVLLGGDGVDEMCGGYLSIGEVFKQLTFKNYHSINDLNNNKKSFIAKKYVQYRLNNRKRIFSCFNHIKNKAERLKQTLLMEDLSIFLPNCTLIHGDDYSMLNSVELRNPFVNINLIKFVINLPIRDKCFIDLKKNFQGKYIFRELAKKIYGNIIDQPKEGTRNFSKLISDKKIWNLEKFEIFKYLKISKEKISEYNFKQIFKFINLEILYRDIKNKKKFYIENLLNNKGKKIIYE